MAAVAAVAALAWAPAPAGAVGSPDAEFSFTPAAPAAGQPVRFDASATTEVGGVPAEGNYSWEFDGDNDFNDAVGKIVTRAFPAAGSFTVTLRVVGTDGISTGFEAKVVNVSPNRLPSATFFYVPIRPAVNEVVQFSSTARDPDGPLASQTWDLDGDGAFDDASGQFAFTGFTSPGTRLVSLRVVDSSGAVAVARLPVGVGDPTVADFPLISPFPVVRLAGRLTRRGARVRVLSVTAPAGSNVLVRCRGRLCPRRSARTTTRRTGRPVRIRRFQRRLQAGVVLEVIVSRPGMVGKHTRFLIRRGRAPKRRDGCVLPGSTRRSSCPRR